MNEATSIFMTMIESTLNKMIDARVDALVAQRLEKVEEQVGSLMNCQDNDQMDNAKRIEALENAQRPGTTLGVAVMDLQSMEFACAVQKIIDMYAMNDGFITGILDNDQFNDKMTEIAKEAADSAADEAMDNHTSEYDHDDIHESSEMDDDAIREIVGECLENVTISIKI
jgi:hypothetical protein